MTALTLDDVACCSLIQYPDECDESEKCKVRVVLCQQVKRIGITAFSHELLLTSVRLHNVTIIDQAAFSSCTNLKEIHLPATKKIYDRAFAYCENLQNIHWPKVMHVGIGVFSHCHSMTQINIPSELIIINDRMFYNCKQLQTITMHNKVEKIGDSSFRGCESLIRVYLPKQLKIIKESAFHGCRKMTTITLHNHINHIGKAVFKRCRLLSTIILPTVPLPIFNRHTFYGCKQIPSVYSGGEFKKAIRYLGMTIILHHTNIEFLCVLTLQFLRPAMKFL